MIEVKKFSADAWCGPCRMLTPILNKLATEITDVKFTTLDVDTQYQQSMKYNVRSVPTVIIERDGKEINRFTGLQSEFAYKNAINEAKSLEV